MDNHIYEGYRGPRGPGSASDDRFNRNVSWGRPPRGPPSPGRHGQQQYQGPPTQGVPLNFSPQYGHHGQFRPPPGPGSYNQFSAPIGPPPPNLNIPNRPPNQYSPNQYSPPQYPPNQGHHHHHHHSNSSSSSNSNLYNSVSSSYNNDHQGHNSNIATGVGVAAAAAAGGYIANSYLKPSSNAPEAPVPQLYNNQTNNSISPNNINQSGRKQNQYAENSSSDVSTNNDGNFSPIPSAPQAFSDELNDYSFLYSNCKGKKKALIVGINYIGQKYELKGCINDAHNLSDFLVQYYGYEKEDMVMLTDDILDATHRPNRENIIRGMKWLVQDSKPNDSLVFHYSGHGGRTEDLDGDEDDGFDDVIYPVDFEKNGFIVDDEMHEIMVRPLEAGVRLTALYDSCHSGTALDLPYVYSTKGIIKEPNLLKEAGQGLLETLDNYNSGNFEGIISTATSLARRAGRTEEDRKKVITTKTSPADVISISGSKDNQTSADSFADGKATGAMSHAFISVLKKDLNQSCLSLLNGMRDELKDKYKQKPQLSASHPMDMNIKFIM